MISVIWSVIVSQLIIGSLIRMLWFGIVFVCDCTPMWGFIWCLLVTQARVYFCFDEIGSHERFSIVYPKWSSLECIWTPIEVLPFLCNRIPKGGLEMISIFLQLLFCSKLGKFAYISSLRGVLELLLLTLRILKSFSLLFDNKIL